MGEYKEMDGFLCPAVGEILILLYDQKLRVIHKFEKDVMGIFS